MKHINHVRDNKLPFHNNFYAFPTPNMLENKPRFDKARINSFSRLRIDLFLFPNQSLLIKGFIRSIHAETKATYLCISGPLKFLTGIGRCQSIYQVTCRVYGRVPTKHVKRSDKAKTYHAEIKNMQCAYDLLALTMRTFSYILGKLNFDQQHVLVRKDLHRGHLKTWETITCSV